jgi:hypothetical protein
VILIFNFNSDAYEVFSLLSIFSNLEDLPLELRVSLLEKLCFAENLVFAKEAVFQTIFIKSAITHNTPFLFTLIDKLSNYDVTECILVADLNSRQDVSDILRKKLATKCRQKNCTCEAFHQTEQSTKCDKCNHSRLWHQTSPKPQAESLV